MDFKMDFNIWEYHYYRNVQIILGHGERVWQYTIRMGRETLSGFGLKSRDEALESARALIDRALVAKEINV